jgi:hypothetical protein
MRISQRALARLSRFFVSLLVVFLFLALATPGSAWMSDQTRVDSMEYKLLLRAEEFASRNKAVKTFWGDVMQIAEGMGLQIQGKMNKEKRRKVRFLDTDDFRLRERNFVFRERVNLKKEDKEAKRKKITLKFRGGCLEQVDMVDVRADEKKEDRELKLEEDVIPPHVSKFSKSGSAKVKNKKKFETVADLTECFPWAHELGDSVEDLIPVNDFLAYEIKVEGPAISLDAATDAEPSFTFWYAGNKEAPLLVAEFSFAHQVKGASGLALAKANHLFTGIQTALQKWIDDSAKTKTQTVYDWGKK